MPRREHKNFFFRRIVETVSQTCDVVVEPRANKDFY